MTGLVLTIIVHSLRLDLAAQCEPVHLKITLEIASNGWQTEPQVSGPLAFRFSLVGRRSWLHSVSAGFCSVVGRSTPRLPAAFAYRELLPTVSLAILAP